MLYLLVTGLVLARLTPSAVRLNLATAFRARYVIPVAAVLLALGWSAGSLGIGRALPLMALVVTALVMLESRLRRRHFPS